MATTMVCAELRQVLVVSRHGVRGPYGPEGLPPTEANMQRYSKDKYPFPVKATDWGTSDDATELVSPKITKHGARVIRNMGEVTSLFDSLSEAQFLSEWFLLQSLNNMSLPPAMTLADVVSLGVIHKVHMDLITNEFNSENFGSTLLVHLVASMQQTIQQASPVSVKSGNHDDDDDDQGPHLLQSLSNKFLFYAGHDINLLFLKNLTAEVDFYVQAYFVAASPSQIRHAETLSPHNAAGLAIRQQCVSPTLAKYAATLLTPPHPSASWTFKIVVVTVLSVALLGVVWKYIARFNQAKSPEYTKYTALT
ncbi:hypothetical protein DYB37_003667 [Aphanomyces astaci]|uniref:Histidine acid phosphatase n=1 Tax=Aphanomyces astaci TaxID=112090 RepID=A0A3R7AFS7_APHAT|nr:hypothetical protein DYB37_003667 [Aphanomyces astaci]